MSQAGLIDIENSNPQIPTTFDTDSASAVPIANTLEVTGSIVSSGANATPLHTVGTGNTVDIELQVGSARTGAPGDTNDAGVVSFDDSDFSVDANGFVTFIGASGSLDSLTGDDSEVVSADGAGNIDIRGFVVANTANAKPLFIEGDAASSLIGVEIQVGAAVLPTPADTSDAGIVSFDNSQFSVTANGFVSLTGGPGPSAQTLTGDAGGAVGPDGSGDIDIQGVTVANAANSKPVFVQGTPGSNLVEVDVQVGAARTGSPSDANDAGMVSFDDTAFSVDANGYVTLAGGAGPAIDSFTTDVSGPVVPTAGGVVDVTGTSIFSDGTTANTLTLNVQATSNTFLVGAGSNSTATELGPLTDGQLIIGNTAGAPTLASLTAPAAGITITGGSGSITFALANDLSAVEGLSGTGLASRTAADTWTTSSITDNAIIVGNSGQTVQNIGPLTDGQLVIGATGAVPAAATLTAGTNVSITNGTNSITINANTGAQEVSVTAIDDTDSPYTVLAADYYLSSNVTNGVLTIDLPDAPNTGRVVVVKDVAGNASNNNITVTTTGGAVNIDGAATFVMNTDYEAANFLFNGSSWEVH